MKSNILNCDQARSICILEALTRLGHLPSSIRKKEAWFLSPLRTETQASFKVSMTLNRWYDYGIGKGGNVIDLVCLIRKCSVAEALAFLSDEQLISSFSRNNKNSSQINEPKNKILKITPIEHYLLKKYLSSRKISFDLARIYCREIWYECNGRQFFALGLENHLGGWELRNPYIKSSTAPKTYSFLKRGSEQLIIMEGMFDLLSLATISPEKVETADLMVLNSLSFMQGVLPLLTDYTTTTLLLDRDPSGRSATADVLRKCVHCWDGSDLYDGYKDLNEKLVER